MLYYPFNMAVQSLQTESNFPKFDDTNVFSQIHQTPGPDFRKVGKSRD